MYFENDLFKQKHLELTTSFDNILNANQSENIQLSSRPSIGEFGLQRLINGLALNN